MIAPATPRRRVNSWTVYLLTTASRACTTSLYLLNQTHSINFRNFSEFLRFDSFKTGSQFWETLMCKNKKSIFLGTAGPML
jgi:hypothetical protein